MELFDEDIDNTHKTHCLRKVVLVGKILDDERTNSFTKQGRKLLVLDIILASISVCR